MNIKQWNKTIWKKGGSCEVQSDQKSLAPDDYSTENTQKYLKQFQSLAMIT
jgi:hypothetical protein